MGVRLAKEVMALEEEIVELGALIEAKFREHPHASTPNTGSASSTADATSRSLADATSTEA